MSDFDFDDFDFDDMRREERSDGRTKARVLKAKAALIYVRAHPGCTADEVYKNTGGRGSVAFAMGYVSRIRKEGVYHFYLRGQEPLLAEES
jgi:hypothetical protein